MNLTPVSEGCAGAGPDAVRPQCTGSTRVTSPVPRAQSICYSRLERRMSIPPATMSIPSVPWPVLELLKD